MNHKNPFSCCQLKAPLQSFGTPGQFRSIAIVRPFFAFTLIELWWSLPSSPSWRACFASTAKAKTKVSRYPLLE
jgi:hypothetical protein